MPFRATVTAVGSEGASSVVIHGLYRPAPRSGRTFVSPGVSLEDSGSSGIMGRQRQHEGHLMSSLDSFTEHQPLPDGRWWTQPDAITTRNWS